MDPSVAIRRRHGPSDDGNERSCGLDRTALPVLHDCLSNSPGIALLSILKDDVRELLFGTTIHQIGGSFSDRLVHAHVKRTFSLKAEPPRRIIQLWRRNPKIEKHTIDRRDTGFSKVRLQVPITPLSQHNTVSESIQSSPAEINGLRISV